MCVKVFNRIFDGYNMVVFFFVDDVDDRSLSRALAGADAVAIISDIWTPSDQPSHNIQQLLKYS